MESKEILIIECCQNCSLHQWNTRHKEERYNSFFSTSRKKLNNRKVESSIQEGSPTVEVWKNKIPKDHIKHPLYKNIIIMDGPSNELQPRLGSFEISHNGQVK